MVNSRLKRTFKTSIRFKFLLAFLSVAVALLALLGVFISAYTRTALKDEFIESSSKYLYQVMHNIDQNIDYIDRVSIMSFLDQNVINILRKDKEHGTAKTPENQSQMDSFLFSANELMDNISGIYIFSESNIYYRSTNGINVDIDYNYKNDDWYKQAYGLNGKIIITGAHLPYQNSQTDQYVFSITRCIIDPKTREQLGAILIDIEIESVYQASKVDEVYDDSFLIITDNDDKIIYSPYKEQLANELILAKGYYFENQEGSAIIEMLDTKGLVNYITSDYTGWRIMQFIPYEVMYKRSNTINTVLIIAVIVLIIISVILSASLSKVIAKRILRLNNIVEEIGSGNLDVYVPDMGNDEISELALGIRKMTIKLKNLMTRVTTAKLRKREAQLKFLQEQVNPHFLYNALNSIQMTAAINKDMNVAHMIDRLGQFIKLNSLNFKNIVTVREEIDLLKAYLSVISIRYKKDFTYEIDIPSEIYDNNCIKLIIQPIVENAVVHGLENVERKKYIKISAGDLDGSIEIHVKDNGKGMTEDELETLKSNLEGNIASDSIGLVNVNQRLKLNYGDEYGIEIFSEQGIGTEVIIRIPKTLDLEAKTQNLFLD